MVAPLPDRAKGARGGDGMMLECGRHDARPHALRDVSPRAPAAPAAVSGPVHPIRLDGWALVLGASSGFGEAASLALARAGLDIFGVHLDRRAGLPNVERIVAEIRAMGRAAHFFNVNAADDDKRGEVAAEMERLLRERDQLGQLRVMLHSLAFGTLKLFIADPMKEAVTKAQMDMTLDVMAHSLVYWAQELVGRGLMGAGGRIFAMTSSGGARVLPYYGPVSAAKAALESNIRQLAAELAPLGITANCIRGGVTDTPALRKIPGADAIKDAARRRNPGGRLTTTEDVARALVALSHPDTQWMTGNVIGVDGGEEIVGS
jgi:enoyl-[acyl-carrier protein] reductase III